MIRVVGGPLPPGKTRSTEQLDDLIPAEKWIATPSIAEWLQKTPQNDGKCCRILRFHYPIICTYRADFIDLSNAYYLVSIAVLDEKMKIMTVPLHA
jgi:hypothetical protein